MADSKPNLLTIRRFAEKYSETWSQDSLRWLRFHDQTNGFEGAFLKVGRRVLIDEERFFAAIRKLNGQG